MARKVEIYTDGASRGNPGRSASGFAVYENSRLLKRLSKYNGIKTNNFAEYTAIILALRWCANTLGAPKDIDIELYSDSELVVRQLNGRYRVRSVDMRPLNDSVQRLKGMFRSVTFANRRRSHEGISEVDAELNRLLDSIEAKDAK